MDTWDAIRTKRMVRRFEPRPLETERLELILDAGRHAGSSKNSQRWDFIVIDDRAQLGELSKVGPYAGHLAGAAVAIALITPDPRGANGSPSDLWDLGAAADNMMLAAWAMGIGSCPATVYDPALAQELLGYPDGLACPYLLSFGYPADPADLTRPPKAGGRKALDEVVHRGRW
ncbi:MAG TPA: nitroreductase family protein [Candidatus Limnocylindrales bacterium]|nr:nitroreductase family protein [Candidatus Limnocylindrales bacterium]